MWTKEQQDCRPGNQLVVTLVHMTGDVDLQWGGGGGVTVRIVTSAQTSEGVSSFSGGSTFTSVSS